MQNINYTIFLDKNKNRKFNFNLLYSLIHFLHLYNKWSSVFVIGYPSHYVSFQVSVLVFHIGNDPVAFQLGVYFCVMVTVVSDELFPNNAGVNLYADEFFLFLNNSRYITLCLSIQENFIKWIKKITFEILSSFSMLWLFLGYHFIF